MSTVRTKRPLEGSECPFSKRVLEDESRLQDNPDFSKHCIETLKDSAQKGDQPRVNRLYQQLHPEEKTAILLESIHMEDEETLSAIVLSGNIPETDKAQAFAAAQLSSNIRIKEAIAFLKMDSFIASLFDGFTIGDIGLG